MTEITESILASIKRLLGISENDTEFDPEIVVIINSNLANLTQMGVGPKEGFLITDNTQTWYDYLGDNIVKQYQVSLYLYAKVKLVFDSANLSSTTIDSLNKIINECEYRLYTENGQY